MPMSTAAGEAVHDYIMAINEYECEYFALISSHDLQMLGRLIRKPRIDFPNWFKGSKLVNMFLESSLPKPRKPYKTNGFGEFQSLLTINLNNTTTLKQ